MNWMGSAKGRAKKRKTSVASIQRQFFAVNRHRQFMTNDAGGEAAQGDDGSEGSLHHLISTERRSLPTVCRDAPVLACTKSRTDDNTNNRSVSPLARIPSRFGHNPQSFRKRVVDGSSLSRSVMFCNPDVSGDENEITRDVKQSTDFPAVTDGEDWRILSAESHRVGFQGKSSACLTSRGIAEYPADVEDVNTAVPGAPESKLTPPHTPSHASASEAESVTVHPPAPETNVQTDLLNIRAELNDLRQIVAMQQDTIVQLKAEQERTNHNNGGPCRMTCRQAGSSNDLRVVTSTLDDYAPAQTPFQRTWTDPRVGQRELLPRPDKHQARPTLQESPPHHHRQVTINVFADTVAYNSGSGDINLNRATDWTDLHPVTRAGRPPQQRPKAPCYGYSASGSTESIVDRLGEHASCGALVPQASAGSFGRQRDHLSTGPFVEEICND
ncbi:hypothetical protein PBRA_003598 [Plasmodiophora brassicae]|uniref:Uncharacterized protein n=1 Tax=Plasmodiophora brassicae TaxID=37360 RepID=A0A0G4II84_PLABS|nr:hypothetical protein PBRA_003598 [Plasmodiophora brassicae]